MRWKLVRLLIAIVMALPLLMVANQSSAATCLAVSYSPEFTSDAHLYVRGSGQLSCSGQDVIKMGIRSVLQRYYAIDGHWADMTTQTASNWSTADGPGYITTRTVSLSCLTRQKISYRTRIRWYVDRWYGNDSGTNSLYSGYKTMECGR